MPTVNWRFSLLTLFGVIAVVAVACAALTNPSTLWACVVETGVLATLIYAVLAAVFRRESRRAFWIGLSIVGWGYALLVARHNVLDGSTSWSGYGNYGSIGFAIGQSSLVTTRLALWWAERREGAPWVGTTATLVPAPGYYSVPTTAAPPPATVYAPAPAFPTPSPTPIAYDPERYLRLVRIGEYLWALLLGIAGGFVARWMYANRCPIPANGS